MRMGLTIVRRSEPLRRSQLRSPRSLTATILVVIAGTSCAGRQSGAVAGRSCDEKDLRRIPAQLDVDHRAYVEPNALSALANGDVMVAGTPAYLWRAGAGGYELQARDSLFGLVLRRDDSVFTIPNPLPGRFVADVRAIADGPSQWAVTFAQVGRSTSFEGEPSVLRMWFGITDGARWIQVEQLPAVNLTLQAARASLLVRDEGRLVLAVPGLRDGLYRMALFEQGVGGWTASVANVGRINSLGLTVVGSTLMAAVVQPDTSELTEDNNSIILYERELRTGTWTRVKRLVRGGATPTFDPTFTRVEGRLVASWRVRGGAGGYEAYAVPVDSGPAQHTIPVRLSPAVMTLAPSASTERPGRWAIQEFALKGSRTGALRLVVLENGALRELVRTVDPFQGPAGIIATSSRAVVAGPLPKVADGDPPVTTLFLSLNWRCDDQE